MQKYRIKKIISNSTQSSCGVDLYGINGKAMAEYKNFKLFCSPNGLRIDDKIRMYNTRSSGSLELRKAISYKVNGKIRVDIVGEQMSSLSDIKYFYSDMDFVDSVRLKCDVARALFERKIVPHFSAVRNLELLLFSGTAPVKTL